MNLVSCNDWQWIQLNDYIKHLMFSYFFHFIYKRSNTSILMVNEVPNRISRVSSSWARCKCNVWIEYDFHEMCPWDNVGFIWIRKPRKYLTVNKKLNILYKCLRMKTTKSNRLDLFHYVLISWDIGIILSMNLILLCRIILSIGSH